jgi:hypothetical protein
LKPSGKKEAFTATLAYETPDLYGKIEASWKIAIASE